MEEAGLEEGLCDSVLVAVSAMDKAKMCPAEELKGKEPQAELENCDSVHDHMPHSLSLNYHFMCRDIRSLFNRDLVTHSIASLSSLPKSLDLKLCQPIYADIKPSNVLLKDSRPKQVNMNNFSDFPPGFRFNPDEEVISNYLRLKSMSRSIHDLVKEHVSRTFLDFDDNTWSLPDICLSPKREWYFFNYRERKYHTTRRTLRVQNPWGKHMDGYSQRRFMKKPEAKLAIDYMNSGGLSPYDPIFALYDSAETFAMNKKEKHQTGMPVEKKKVEDIHAYPAASIPEVWEPGNARARADLFHAEVLWLGEQAKRLDHSWRKAELAVDYMNAASHSVDITYASNVMETRGERLFYDVQSYQGAYGKITNWPLNIFQKGCRKSSELQKVWLQENKIVSWSSASYLLLVIFSLYITTTLLSSLNSQESLIDGNRAGKHELHTNQLPSGLEGDVIRLTGSFYDHQIANKYMSWTVSSSFLLLPTALLVAILLLELSLESRMSNESYQVDCGRYTEFAGSGLRGHKQKHSRSRDAGITKGIAASPTSASYALLLIALLSTMLSLLVALNFGGSISVDGSYPGSSNLYRGWLFISINSTVFFTSVAVMVILMHELSLGTWLMTSTLSMLGSYACLVIKVAPFHGMPLLLLGIPSAMLARALRNAVSA